MLLLRRKVGESVLIDGGRIVAKLIKIDPNTDECTIGFDAPSAVEIEREERFYRKLRHATAVNDATLPTLSPSSSDNQSRTNTPLCAIPDRNDSNE